MTQVRIEEISSIPPIDLFNSVCDKPYSFFLDGESDNRRLSRFSFIGWDPFLVFKSKRDRVELSWKSGKVETLTADPFDILERTFRRYAVNQASRGVPFTGGAVGYLAYDLKDFIELLPDNALDDIRAPDCAFGFYDTVVIYDHLKGGSYIASSGLPEANPAKAARRKASRIEYFKDALRRPAPSLSEISLKKERLSARSNFSKNGYLAAIRKAKEYIGKGDIYQVNLSQRFTADLDIAPAELYRRLRTVSPAPFSAYLGFGDIAIASSSPERFLLKDGAYIETRPIKGTRPRGRDKLEDAMLARELLNSAKDGAEHIMIVDLERNDLGRICKYGTVKPTESLILERYPNVFHLVSTVTGTLRDNVSAVDCLRAAFPGGSITGAPKIRSMEIIEELEPVKRSVYTGAIGYISFGGDMDMSIAIRTFLIKDKKAYFSVGGGIVTDSDPELEYEETLHKAKGMMEALGIVDCDTSAELKNLFLCFWYVFFIFTI